MKKKFLLRVVLPIVLVAVLASIATIAVLAKPEQASDGASEERTLSFYADEAKVGTKVFNVDGHVLELTYSYTYNPSEIPLSARADCYGTYEVYVDEEGSEFSFLAGTDRLCAYSSAELTRKCGETLLPEEEALKIAQQYLDTYRPQHENYRLDKCSRDTLTNCYDIIFVYYVDGYRTDDEFRLWIDDEKEIVCYTEFNYGRYDDVEVSTRQYEKAEALLDAKIQDSYGDFITCHTYISKNNAGKIVLVKEVDVRLGFSIPIEQEI